MTDQYGVIYGAALIAGGLLGYFRSGSLISLLFGVILGALTIYNSTHGTRQHRGTNFFIAAALGLLMLTRFAFSRKVFPALPVVGLSVVQAYRNYAYLK